jgi:monoamine oxidase
MREIVFEPALPASRAALHDGMPMGAAGKCVAVYDTPFWREQGLSGQVVSDEGPCHVTFDSSPPEGKPGVMLGFVEGDGARALAKLPPEERRAQVLECFARYFGDRARSPRLYTDKLWEQDEWARGCYGAFCPPGLLTAHGAALRPAVGPLYWAGTETAQVWSGYIDGALSSGEAAAEDIIHGAKR